VMVGVLFVHQQELLASSLYLDSESTRYPWYYQNIGISIHDHELARRTEVFRLAIRGLQRGVLDGIWLSDEIWLLDGIWRSHAIYELSCIWDRNMYSPA
jgi:hypothetical protein